MDGIPKIGKLAGLEELSPATATRRGDGAPGFAESLKDAILEVDRVQKDSEAAQQAYARHEEVDLHDVLIKIEEAEIAFKSMMEIRNKLVDAYREVMRMGS